MSDDRPKPPAGWLQHLYDSRRWDRLVEMANESLAADPNDPDTHRLLSWGYIKCGLTEMIGPHVTFLLQANPDDLRHHQLAALHHMKLNQFDSAKPHVEHLLASAPEEACYQHLACLYACRRGDHTAARRHIKEVRRINPGWAAAALFEYDIECSGEPTARQSWQRVRRLEEVLSLDPEYVDVLERMADIHLNELEQPQEAAELYRRALAVEPKRRALADKLLRATQAQSLLHRTLALPRTLKGKVVRYFDHHPTGDPVDIMLELACAVFFFVWFAIMTALFTPVALVYEWFQRVDLTRPDWLAKQGRLTQWFLQSPFWLRVGAVVTLWVAMWTALLSWWFDDYEVTTLLWIFVFHWGLVVLWVACRKVRSAYGRWLHERYQKRLTATQLPEKAAEGAQNGTCQH